MNCGVQRMRDIAGVLAFVLMAGCASPKPPTIPAPLPPAKPAVVQAEVIAAPELNPDRNGRPSPIVVRLFELKSLATFQSADFFSLYDRDQETLGGDMIGRDELELRPGDRRNFERQLGSDTRYVAIIAAFRDLEHSRWRSAFPVPPNQTTRLRIRLDAGSVSIDIR